MFQTVKNHPGMGRGMTWVCSADSEDLTVLAAHLGWLYDVVLREMIPEGDSEAQFVDKMCKVCQALDTHDGDARSLFAGNSKLAEFLSDGALYIYASRVVYADLPVFVEQTLPSREAVDRHATLLHWLTKEHSFACDLEEAAAAQELSKPVAFSLAMHNTLIDFLLREYCASFVSVDDIHAHIASFTHHQPSDESLEASLLCWLHKVASLFSDTEITRDPGSDFAESLQDGKLLALTYYKYDTSFLAIDSLNLTKELSDEQKVQNWAIILDACRRSKVSPPFSAEQLVYLTSRLRWHLLWLTQMSYVVLKRSCDGILGGCPLQYEMQPGVMGNLTAYSPVEERSRYRYCDDAITCSITRSSATASIGINMSLDPQSLPVVQDVEPGSTACRSGVRKGMVISSIDGIDIHSCLDLAKMMTGKKQFRLSLSKPMTSSISFVRESIKLLMPASPLSSSSNGASHSEGGATPETQFLLRSSAERCTQSPKPEIPFALQDISMDMDADEEASERQDEGEVVACDEPGCGQVDRGDAPGTVGSLVASVPEVLASPLEPFPLPASASDEDDGLEGSDTAEGKDEEARQDEDAGNTTLERVNIRKELMNELMQLEAEVDAIPLSTPARNEEYVPVACSPDKMRVLAQDVVSNVRLSINRGRDTARIPGARPLSRSSEKHLQAMQEENERLSEGFRLRTLTRFNSRKLNRVASVATVNKEISGAHDDEQEPVPKRRLAPVRSAPILRAVPVQKKAEKYAAPRCNRKQIVNALKHVCLPGKINAKMQLEVLGTMDDVPGGTHFVLLLKAELQPNFKALYAYGESSGYIKVYGMGPRALLPESVDCLRYDCGLKRFSLLPPSFKLCNPRVDAVCLQMAQAP
eukprot:TRINITY_DN9025_c0_g1_i1.p1 TRINITY_DN9025_c0_g1~~TRINITY_DN9025_c0_g1_i1.p1  ORF type:complete len:870 (+),score=241.52 TRINITY_DN9025_c0_g1_i1:188-2797(+)